MKKVLLIVLAVGFLFVGTNSLGAASPFSQLAKDISDCLCGGGGPAFKFGCRTYLWNRLQQPKAPDEAASRATTKCENEYGLTKPDGNTKCKQGVTFLRSKE